MTFLQFFGATLIPGILTGLFALLLRKTKAKFWHAKGGQILIGIAFGIVAIWATENGVVMDEEAGVIMNVRDAAPLCAGLFFGGPAGLIAGLIGGVYRWFCVYWGGGMVTRVACSLATVLAGIFSGMMRKNLFDGGRPGMFSALGIGATMEVLHMLLVLATNMSNVAKAFEFVQGCAIPMILCNGIALCIASVICGGFERRNPIDLRDRYISYDFGFRLLVCVVIAFLLTSGFTQQVVYRITSDNAQIAQNVALYRDVTLYLVAFMEILIFTALFILVYQLLKKKVTKNPAARPMRKTADLTSTVRAMKVRMRSISTTNPMKVISAVRPTKKTATSISAMVLTLLKTKISLILVTIPKRMISTITTMILSTLWNCWHSRQSRFRMSIRST